MNLERDLVRYLLNVRANCCGCRFRRIGGRECEYCELKFLLVCELYLLFVCELFRLWWYR